MKGSTEHNINDLTDDEIEILEIYRSASEEGKELLINKLMELLEENK